MAGHAQKSSSQKDLRGWTFQKEKSIGEILVRQNAFDQSACNRLGQMVALHINLHAGDVQKSLQSVGSASDLIDAIREVKDADVQFSLGHVPATTTPSVGNDLPTTVGQSTSQGTRFRILRPHAKGGLGEVYLARDEELNREVALKEIQGQHAFRAETRSRFRMESEITGALEHPGIVPVYGLGAYADGRPFYAMRFIRGENLKEAIRRYHESNASESENRLAFRELLKRFIDVCDAMQYAHSRGVLHRDLKPGNIMLGKFGETLVVDWGLSKAVGREEVPIPSESMISVRPQSSSDVTPTQYGSVLGTLQYMSPEQAAGKVEQIGPATDV